MKLKITFLLSYALLVGCVSNQKFDCPQTGGIRCKSMSEIDKLVDRGDLKNKTLIKFPKTRFIFPTKMNQTLPLRAPEEVIQIWIGAYESVDGIYHHPSMLNIVVKPGNWR